VLSTDRTYPRLPDSSQASSSGRRSKELRRAMTDQSLRRGRDVLGAILAIAVINNQLAYCWAQVKDVHAGYELASKICSPCHVIGPLPGPSFMDIAKGDYRSAAPLKVSFAPPTATSVTPAECLESTSLMSKFERFPLISAAYERRTRPCGRILERWRFWD